jgi:hypothetical protein
LANAEPVVVAVEKAMLKTLPERERESLVSALQRLAMPQ